ncbi:MAG TPA: PRC-barrel domain-containing protein [Bauldia sp.]|nr:PRC-barrel domain-containing protein [Bauldia sp.]
MLKQLLAATAIVTIATAAQAAQPAATNGAASNSASTVLPATGQMFLPAAMTGDHLATKLIGAAVYESDAADAQSIGNVNDIVIADNGAVSAVVVGVGGFLGIGQKNVALDFTSLHWANRDGGPVLVAALSKDQLNNAPGFDTAALDQSLPANGTTAAPADQTAQTNAPAAPADQSMAPADQMAAAPPADTNGTATQQVAPNDTLAQQSAPDAGTGVVTDQTQTAQNTAPAAGGATATVPNAADLQSVDVATVSAKELMNATVYSATNENVGEVGDVILAQDGKIDAVVLDVGGFLGLGEKPVAIGFAGLDIRKDTNGALFVYTKFTKDQLEAAPQYDKNAYATSRDTMRLMSPS